MKKDTNSTSAQEMEQIQHGLEEFLRREMQEMEANGGSRQAPDEPQLFTIEEEEQQEKGLDVIGVQRNSSRRNRRYEEEYVEDWDSPDYRSSSRSRDRSDKSGSTGGRSNNSAKRSRAESSKRESSKRESSKRESSKRENSKRENSKRENSKRENSKRENSRRSQGNGKDKKKKKGRFKRFLIILLIVAVLLLAGLYWLVGVVYEKMNYRNIESVAMEPLKEDGVVNILLIGNDSRENGEDGRSDAMILVSISNKTKKIYMTSLLRDMYMEIPGHDGNRLNAAYSFGGAELLMETIEQNLDISVNRYVLVNFEAFANLVDAVGGVELELTSEEIEYVNGYLVEYNMLTNRPQGTDNMDTSVSGLVHLNGPQALAYSRNRYLGTDFGRTERQRKVLEAVIRKLPKTVITNPKELIDGLMPNLTTNLTQWECFRLSLMADKLISYDIVQDSIPIEGSYQNATIRKMSVLEVDFEANKKYLQEKIYGKGSSVEK